MVETLVTRTRAGLLLFARSGSAVGPAHVAGLSWGGTVVQELYRHHPGLVATLILIDTYAGWKGSLPAEEVRARVAGARQMLAAPAKEFDPTFPGLFAGDPPAEFVPLLEEIAAAVRPASLMTQLLLMAEADQRDLLPRIAVPTLLIWGELDARSPLNVARQFEQAIPDTKLVVIPRCGHASNLEQPEQFNEAVREFCCGDRPSTTLLIYGALTPNALGRLVALYEHRAFTEGVLWGIDSFDQWGVELGKVLAGTLADQLTDPERPQLDHDSSTVALVSRYRASEKRP